MNIYAAGGKRALDVVVSALVLALLLPLLALIAIVIRLEDGGPPIFRQRRIGRQGKPFTLLKFRSMPVGSGDRPSHEAQSLRVTRFGTLMRRTNIDELPQLVNVLRGDMSIVGPRPPLATQDELIQLRTANGALNCRPGLTGLAQVESYDGMPVGAKADFDGRYAARIRLWSDLHIIWRTFGYLTKRPPVY